MKKQIALFIVVVAALLLILNVIFNSKATSSGGAGKDEALAPIIAGMKEVRSVHLSGTVLLGTGPAPMDLWAVANPEQTESTDLKLVVRLPLGTQTLIVHDNVSYDYRPWENTVHKWPGKKMVLDPWMGSKFFELLDAEGRDWTQSPSKDNATTRPAVLTATCGLESLNRAWWFEFDAQTHKLLRFKQWQNLQRTGPPQLVADNITYNEEFPKDFFVFAAPKGTKVIDMAVLDDPKYGLAMDNQTETAAAIRICTEYWQAKISGDAQRAHLLRPTMNEKEHQAQFAANPPEKILEIGKPPIQRRGDALIVPCQIKFKDGWLRTINLVVQLRPATTPPSLVIAGARGWEVPPTTQEAMPTSRPLTQPATGPAAPKAP